MYICPHCNQPGISVLRKLYLGPAIPATCKNCGKKVGVPWSAMFVTVAGIIAYFSILLFVDSILLIVAVLVVVFFIMSFIHLKWIPLIPK